MSLLSQHNCALSSGRRPKLTAEQKVKLLETARNRRKNGEEVTLEWIISEVKCITPDSWEPNISWASKFWHNER
jgi:hypothetical protein